MQTDPTDPLLEKLKQAFDKHDGIAAENQNSRRTFALFAAALGPVAVFLLSVQILFFEEGGFFACLLILGELVALAVALAVGFLEITRSHATWIRARLRAEILRREMFLLQMRVGPYLQQDPPTEIDVDQRLALIDADERDPEDFIPLRDEECGHWRDALVREWLAGNSTSIPCQPECTDIYLKDRVCDQRDWFNRKSGVHAALARKWENGAKVTLLVALIVAALHLGMLIVDDHAVEATHAQSAPASARQHPARDGIHNGLITIAICLPALGAALVGGLSILGSHRLTRSYRYSASVLNEIERGLRRLKAEIVKEQEPTTDQNFELKRLVLRTEELLSDDLLRWWLVMEPEAPKAGP